MLHDLRYVLRGLHRSPGFTAVAVLTIALGIGATTAVYTLLERVVLDPLPYPDADRLVRLTSRVPGADPDAVWQLSAGEYFYFGRHSQTIDDIGAHQRTTVTVQSPDGPSRVRLGLVSAGTFRLLGAQPALGRLIADSDDRPGAPSTVVLSHAFWQRQFGGDRGVVGRALQLGTQISAEIIGVVAPGVDLPGVPRAHQTDVWIPMRLNPDGPFHNSHVIPMFARLREGATIDEAQAEMDLLTTRLPEELPTVYSAAFFERYGFRTAVESLKSSVVGDVAPHLWTLVGAVGLVLIIACANVANLFLVRLEARRRELAIRAALGASRATVARLFALESLVLALTGAAAGGLLGSWGVGALVALAPPTIPRLDDIRIDGSILAVTLGVGVLVAASLLVLAMIRQGRTGASAVAEGGRSMMVTREGHGLRSALIVSQVALALILAVSATLLVESFIRLRTADSGIDPRGVLTLEVALPAAPYETYDSVWRFYADALQRIRALPGVVHGGASTTLPLTAGFGCTVQGFEDPRVQERLEVSNFTACASQQPTSPGYFEAMGIPLLRGRTFVNADNDHPSSGSVVVSRAFAERFWPGEDPIGKGVGPGGATRQQFYRIVGVVGDVYAESVGETPAIVIYYPVVRIPDTSGWSAPRSLRMVVRTSAANPMSMFAGVQAVVRELDATVPVANAEPMQAIVDRSMGRVSFVMTLLGVAAAVALLLAAIGLYGVVSYLVSRRTNELGVRLALGAQPAQVQALVMRGSIALVAAGIAIGTAGAFGVTRLLGGLLFGVAPTDAASFGTAALLLAIVALVASWMPARRAARVNPIVALRYE